MKQSISPLKPGQRIAFIEAGWHQDIVKQSRITFTNEVAHHGIESNAIDLFKVPGSLEIPLQCKLLAKTGQYQLIVAAGLIVDGGIYRHEYVASTVLNAMMKIQLETETPILSVVLTPHQFSENKAHLDFFREHFKLKGAEAAQACIQILQNVRIVNQVAA